MTEFSVVRPVGETNLSLEEVIGFAILKTDRRFSLLPPGSIPLYVRESLNIGACRAREFLAENGRIPGDELCRRFGVALEMQTMALAGRSVRAGYFNNPPRIVINPDLLDAPLLFRTKDELLAALIYHELYHYLEHNRWTPTYTCLPQVGGSKLGFVKTAYHVKAANDIAAHKFCQVVGNMDIFPGVLDYLADPVGLARLQAEYDQILRTETSSCGSDR